MASVNPLDKSKTRQRVYDLPRKSEEARINDYNPLLLLLWKANVDVQPETTMALTGYITAYVTKAEKSAMQQEFADLASTGTLYSRLWKFAHKCFKNRETGAGDLITGDHLNEKSHTVQYVNARLRTRKLKNYSERTQTVVTCTPLA